MSDEFDFDAPDHCTVGVIGEVGQRLFLFYCRQGLTETTVKVEKQQVAVLAGYLGRIVKELGRPGHLPEDVEFYGTEEFEWVVGTIGVSYDEELDRIIVVLEEVDIEDEDEEEEEDLSDSGRVLRVALTREQAAAFAIHATRLVEAGRPPCPLCSLPLDPAGHDCPRTNGHRPPVDLATVSEATVEQILTEGDMEVHGRIAGSSNATLLVTCRLGDEELLAVYKPSKGERPLWDFPGGLFRREVAAYVLSESLGWGLVPETVERPEGPFGPGSVQRFVHEDGTSHYFTLRDEPRWHADAHAAVRVRRRGQQRRPQERPRAPGRGTAVGHRQRPVLQPRRQAAHGHLGLRRLSARGRRARGPGPAGPRRPARRRCASSSSPRRSPPPWTGWPGSSACGPSPSWLTTATGRPIPGRSSEPARGAFGKSPRSRSRTQ